MAKAERLSYLLYRCVQCKRVLTKYQIISKWEAAERDGKDIKGLCVCGCGKVSPTNASVWEELTRPSLWKVWWKDVVTPWYHKRFSK